MKDKNSICLAHFLFPDRKMDKEVTELLHSSSTAERICRLKYSDEENVNDVYLQVHKDKTLVYCNNKPGTSPCELNDPSEVERACFFLFNYADHKVTFEPEVPALLMSKRRYEELSSASQSTALQHLVDSLAEANGDYMNSVELAKVMKCTIIEGELRFCTRSNSGWGFQCATFIGDRTSGWLQRMSCSDAEDWLIAIPMTKSQLCYSFTEWILHPALVPDLSLK